MNRISFVQNIPVRLSVTTLGTDVCKGAELALNLAYWVPDTISANEVSDNLGLTLRPRIDCAGRSGANENVMGASL